MRRRAYSYIRSDVAGIHVQRCEMAARAWAKDHGYDLARTIIDTPDELGVRQLFALLGRNPDAVVLLPSLEHVPDAASAAVVDRRVVLLDGVGV